MFLRSVNMNTIHPYACNGQIDIISNLIRYMHGSFFDVVVVVVGWLHDAKMRAELCTSTNMGIKHCMHTYMINWIVVTKNEPMNE